MGSQYRLEVGNKDRTIVEYALKEANKPIGVATYQMFRELPKELKNELPSPEQIARLLEYINEKEIKND